MEIPIYISLFVLLFLLYSSAWVSSCETALFSLSSHKLKIYHKDPDPRKKLIAELLSHPRDLLVTIFMINTFVNLLLQNVASDMFGINAGWSLKVGVPLVLTLVFGEIIPKYIGLQNNISIAYKTAPTVNLWQNWLKHLRKLIIWVTTPISRLMFFFLKKEKNFSKEEIEHVLKTSEMHGVLNRDEAELLAGYINLQDAQVKELMWPKEDILFYDLTQPLSKLVYLFVEEGRTRIPVSEGSLENVKGIFTAMQFFKQQNRIKEGKDILPMLEKPYYVPETTSARHLLQQMDEQEELLALVVNEYGTLSGLISREDLIEVVVGQIEDFRDIQPLYTPAGKGEVIASGKWELAEFNDYFNMELESASNNVTIGGWLIEQLGDIPKSGSKHELHGFLFQILAASPTRINRLFIRKL